MIKIFKMKKMELQVKNFKKYRSRNFNNKKMMKTLEIRKYR